MPEERAWMSRAASGDESALARLFEGYRDRLRRTVRLRLDARLQGRVDPSDVLQDAFLDARRRLPEYVEAPAVPLSLWLRSITLQRLVDLHRRHLGAKMRCVRREISLDGGDVPEAASQPLAELLVDPARSPCSDVIHREKCRLVQEALDQMEQMDREVLAMRHFEMLSNKEIAQALQISETAASNRYVRAVKRLRIVLTHSSGRSA